MSHVARRDRTVGAVMGRRPGPSGGVEEVPAGTGSRGRWLPGVLGASAICACVLAAHWSVLSAQALNFDDDEYLNKSTIVRSPSFASARRALAEVLRPSIAGYYEPLSVISLMIDYARGGRMENLRPFHETALGLHVANSLLVGLLLYALFRRAVSAAIGAAVFGTHPITVEAVALVAQRKVLLATFFSLLCLLAYVGYVRRGRWGLLVAALGAYVLAVLSKPTSTPIAVVLLLMDIWPLRRFSRRVLAEKMPFLVVAGASALITLTATAGTAGISVPRSSPGRILLMVPYLTAFYLGKIILPIRLTSDYPLPEPFRLGNPAVLTAVLAAVALAVGSVAALRRTRSLLTAGAAFFVLMFPVLGIVNYTWVTASDKHVYLPLVVLVLPVAAGLTHVWDTAWGVRAIRRVWLVGAAAVLIILEVAGSNIYLVWWQDSESLRRRMVQLAPTAHAWSGLTYVLVQKGKYDAAIEAGLTAVALDPNHADAHTNLALAYSRVGNLPAAHEHNRRAAELLPNDPVAQQNLAATLNAMGRFDEAAAHWARALELKPDWSDAWNNWGAACLEHGRAEEALQKLQKALEYMPRHPQARENLGHCLHRLGRPAEAVLQYRAALEYAPGNLRARFKMARALADCGRHAEAVAEYRAVIAADPGPVADPARAELESLLRTGTTRPTTGPAATAPAQS